MSSWEAVPLAKVARLERAVISPAEIRDDMTYVGLEHITGDGAFVGASSLHGRVIESAKFRFTEHHLLYGKLRPYLAKIACPDFGGICSTDILPVLTGPKLERRFLFHFLRQPAMVAHATARSTGANLPRLSPSVLETFEVPLPPLPEQYRIAKILDQAEMVRAKRRTALTQLDTFAQAIFLDLFGDQATNPKAWRQSELGDLIRSGPQNGLYKPANAYGSGTPILRIDAFYDGTVRDLSSLKRVRLSESERSLFGLAQGDIVVNRVNSIDYLGKSALIPELSEPTVFESNMMRMSADPAAVEPGYLVQFLQSQFVRGQILAASKNAVNQSSINQQDVKALRVNVPPLPLQQEFARHVAVVEKLKAAQRASLAQLDALFASLQYRAFRGEL